MGGSYVAGSAEQLSGLLSVPLAGGANVEFNLEKVIFLIPALPVDIVISI